MCLETNRPHSPGHLYSALRRGSSTLRTQTLVAQNTLRRNAAGWKRNFQYAIFVLEFAGPLVSKRGFDPQYASVFDRYAASTRSLLGMFRFSPLKWAFVLSLKWLKKTQKITFVKYLSPLNSYVSTCISQGNLCFWDSGPLLQKSQSTLFPGDISDLGTLALSSTSLKVLYFLGKSLHLGTLALFSRSLKVLYFLGKSLHLGTLALSSKSLNVLYFLGQFSPLLVWHAIRQKKTPKIRHCYARKQCSRRLQPKRCWNTTHATAWCKPPCPTISECWTTLIFLTVGNVSCQFVPKKVCGNLCYDCKQLMFRRMWGPYYRWKGGFNKKARNCEILVLSLVRTKTYKNSTRDAEYAAGRNFDTQRNAKETQRVRATKTQTLENIQDLPPGLKLSSAICFGP